MDDAPPPADAARRRRPAPVRLLRPALPSPLPAGGGLAFARVRGRALAGVGVRDGDHVVLARAAPVVDGALASVADLAGRGALWRVRRDRDALALCDGDGTPVARTGPWPRVEGVVVGVLRRPDAPPASSGGGVSRRRRTSGPPSARGAAGSRRARASRAGP